MKRWGALLAPVLLFAACSDDDSAAEDPPTVPVADALDRAAPSLVLDRDWYDAAYRNVAEALGGSDAEVDPLLGVENPSAQDRTTLPRIIVGCAWGDALAAEGDTAFGALREEEGFDDLAALVTELTFDGSCTLLNARGLSLVARDLPVAGDDIAAREAMVSEVAALEQAFTEALADG